MDLSTNIVSIMKTITAYCCTNIVLLLFIFFFYILDDVSVCVCTQASRWYYIIKYEQVMYLRVYICINKTVMIIINNYMNVSVEKWHTIFWFWMAPMCIFEATIYVSVCVWNVTYICMGQCQNYIYICSLRSTRTTTTNDNSIKGK